MGFNIWCHVVGCAQKYKIRTGRWLLVFGSKSFPFWFWSRKSLWHFQNPKVQSEFLKFWKYVIPRRDCESRTEGGPIIVFTSILLWFSKDVWHFQNYHFPPAFLKFWKCFLPHRDSPRVEPNGQLSLPFYCVWGTVLTLSEVIHGVVPLSTHKLDTLKP